MQGHVDAFLLHDDLPMAARIRAARRDRPQVLPGDYDHLARTDEWTLIDEGGRPRMSRRLQQPDAAEVIARASATPSDPAASVWVEANAGSGKTYVLTAARAAAAAERREARGDPLPHLHQGGGRRDARPRRRAARPNGR